MLKREAIPRETRMIHLVFPGDTNHYHTLFGGTTMGWMDQAAYIAATRWCHRKVVTVHATEFNFKHSVPEGSIVEVVARVVKTGTTSMTIATELWVEAMDAVDRFMACDACFIFVALDDEGNPTQVAPMGGADPDGPCSTV